MIRNAFHAVALVLACAALSILTACTSLGVASPSTFNDKAYAATLTVEQVQKTAATLTRAGKISPADAENVLKSTDAAVAGITIARSYAKADPVAGAAKLDAAVAALTLVQTYLATQGTKP